MLSGIIQHPAELIVPPATEQTTFNEIVGWALLLERNQEARAPDEPSADIEEEPTYERDGVRMR